MLNEIDENRNICMSSFGFTVLRFENRFRFRDPEYLKSEIRKILSKEINRPEGKINHPGREMSFVNIR